MTSLARWAFRHRRIVLGIWIALLIGIGVVNGAVGAAYNDDFKLPATESKQALDILQRDFPAVSGQSGQIVLHARSGSLRDPQVESQVSGMFDRLSKVPGVSEVQGYNTPTGARQITADGSIGETTITFSANRPGPAGTDRRRSAPREPRLQPAAGGGDRRPGVHTPAGHQQQRVPRHP